MLVTQSSIRRRCNIPEIHTSFNFSDDRQTYKSRYYFTWQTSPWHTSRMTSLPMELYVDTLCSASLCLPVILAAWTITYAPVIPTFVSCISQEYLSLLKKNFLRGRFHSFRMRDGHILTKGPTTPSVSMPPLFLCVPTQFSVSGLWILDGFRLARTFSSLSCNIGDSIPRQSQFAT